MWMKNFTHSFLMKLNLVTTGFPSSPDASEIDLVIFGSLSSSCELCELVSMSSSAQPISWSPDGLHSCKCLWTTSGLKATRVLHLLHLTDTRIKPLPELGKRLKLLKVSSILDFVGNTLRGVIIICLSRGLSCFQSLKIFEFRTLEQVNSEMSNNSEINDNSKIGSCNQ